MHTALVHDWLVSIGGGEKALQGIHELFPGDIFTLFHNAKKLDGTYFDNKKIIPSSLQKLPFALKKYQNFLPLFPYAIEQFDFSEYDLIISSSHCAAKGALTHADQMHICYCFTPVRYAWDLYHQYLDQTHLKKGAKGLIAKLILHYFRMWDKSSSSRVDAFVAISKYVAVRINKIYGRQADVIYPPVNTNYYSLEENKQDYYLTASRMVPYKRIDLIVQAFSQMPDKKLVVIGDGPEMKKVKSFATKNIEILGHVSDQTMKDYMQKAKGFVFAALEDFGILPVEAQSAGTPVIAFGKGGSLETVGKECGVFFQKQDVTSLIDAVNRFEKMTFDPKAIRKHAMKFSVERFKEEFENLILQKYQNWTENSI